MLSEPLLAAIGMVPDPTVLLFANGEVLAANGPAREALALANERPRRFRLTELTAQPKELELFLRMCGRCLDPIPGAFSIVRSPSPAIDYLCKGGVVVPPGEDSPALLMLRFWQRSAEGNPFIALNQKIAELSEEIFRRRSAEEALRRSEVALRDRALLAEKLNRIKDEFVATLSHELRTPLNAILGWTKLLRDGRLPPDREERALLTIERNARAQAQLIEELLDMSKIVTGKIRLEIQQLDPIQVVESALEAIRPAAEAKEIQIHTLLESRAGPVLGDPDRLQQVCWNLLSNAVKFTPDGGRIEVSVDRLDSSVQISVTDTGQGIRADFLPHVFDRFRQQDPSITRTLGGLGLGLSIAKSLVELHGGAIEVESGGEGKGATFRVRIPMAPVRTSSAHRTASDSGAGPQRQIDVPPAIRGLRVVVIDDEADATELLVAVLEQAGAEVKSARSADEGLEAVRTVRPDLLISDIGLPREDGYSLIRKIRELAPSEGGRTPAIALTAYARAEERARALTAGFQIHLPKPVDSAELFAVIQSLMGRFSPRAERGCPTA